MPSNVLRERGEFVRANESNRAILEPLIEAHLSSYDLALTELERAHRLIADQTDLELDAERREAALWLVLGRCIGLARAGRALVAAGFTLESVPVLRSMHEAARLLALIGHPGEDDVVDRWLHGRKLSRGDVMAAIRRQEEAARLDMIKEGIAPPGRTGAYFEGQYGRWSEIAHHRRRHMLDQVSVPARIMATGPHLDWRARASAVDHFGWYVTELVSTGGYAIARLLGPEWFHDRFQKTWRALLELMDRIPLAAIAAGDVPPPRRESDATTTEQPPSS